MLKGVTIKDMTKGESPLKGSVSMDFYMEELEGRMQEKIGIESTGQRLH